MHVIVHIHIYIAVKCLALMSTSRHRQSVKKGSGIYEQDEKFCRGNTGDHEMST